MPRRRYALAGRDKHVGENLRFSLQTAMALRRHTPSWRRHLGGGGVWMASQVAVATCPVRRSLRLVSTGRCLACCSVTRLPLLAGGLTSSIALYSGIDDGLASECPCHGGHVHPHVWALTSCIVSSSVCLLPAALFWCGGCYYVVGDLGKAPLRLRWVLPW
jgi:hypothetical protein